MKKIALTVLLMVSLSAMAQEGRRHHPKHDLTPEQHATLQTKKMALALDLTETQQEKVKVIQLENAQIRKTKREEKSTDNSKNLSSEEWYAMAIERLDRQIAQKAEMKKILSADQYEKWQKISHHKSRRLRERKSPNRGEKRKKN